MFDARLLTRPTVPSFWSDCHRFVVRASRVPAIRQLHTLKHPRVFANIRHLLLLSSPSTPPVNLIQDNIIPIFVLI